MNRIPTALQPACSQLRLKAHCQHQRAHCVPGRRGQSALDPTDGSLRRACSQRERSLAETELLAMFSNQRAWDHDIYKYIVKVSITAASDPLPRAPSR